MFKPTQIMFLLLFTCCMNQNYFQNSNYKMSVTEPILSTKLQSPQPVRVCDCLITRISSDYLKSFSIIGSHFLTTKKIDLQTQNPNKEKNSKFHKQPELRKITCLGKFFHVAYTARAQEQHKHILVINTAVKNIITQYSR